MARRRHATRAILALFLIVYVTVVVNFLFTGVYETSSANIAIPEQRKDFVPSLEQELAQRQLERDSTNFWYYIKSQLNHLKRAKPSEVISRIDTILNNGKEMQRTLKTDFHKVNNELNNMTQWRYKESMDLGQIVQKRLEKLQNPSDCKKAKYLVCMHKNQCGFGCELHHVTYCMLMAYTTNRTLIFKSEGWMYSKGGWGTVFQPLCLSCNDTILPNSKNIPTWTATSDFNNTRIVKIPIIDQLPRQARPNLFPLAIPDDIADRLLRFHGNAPAWWIGQFVKYVSRPLDFITTSLKQKEANLTFTSPVVGIHIRRTDKKSEAKYHEVDEYMSHVVEWYDTYELMHPGVERKVFIATDDPACTEEAKSKYSGYTIISDTEVSKSAAVNTRYSVNSLLGVIMDVHLLSICDYVVCTMSSQVCRAAYELMQTIHGDASNYVTSLDDIYYFGGITHHLVRAILPHKAQQNPEGHEIDLQPGDIVALAGDHWNGYSKGTNQRTNDFGLFPSFKVKDVITRVKTEHFIKYTFNNKTQTDIKKTSKDKLRKHSVEQLF